MLLNFFQTFQPNLAGEFVSVDCETTGLDARKDQILSIGGIKIRNGIIRSGESIYFLVRPNSGFTTDSIKIHGILPTEAANGYTPEEAIKRFFDWVGNATILGYNVNFDYTILNRYAKKYLNRKLRNTKVELMSLFKTHFPQNYAGAAGDFSLEKIADLLGIPLQNRHSALGDAMSVGLLFISLMKKYP